MSETFLIAVDASPASEKALDYVARLTANLAGAEYHLVHVVSAADPARLAVGAPADEPHAEERRLLESLRERLVAGGVASERVDLGLLSHEPETSLVDGLIDLARERDCTTLVVGRNSLTWLREKLHHHPADELVKRATGHTVWIVE